MLQILFKEVGTILYPDNYVLKEQIVDFPYGIYPFVARHYKVSSYGFVHNLATGSILPLNKDYNKNHYITIRLSTIDGGAYSDSLHRIVLNAFCPIPNQNLYDVNHKDGVKYHNWLWNLEWCTKSYNMEHAINTGLIPLGEQRVNSVASDAEIEHICELISKGYSTKDICSIIAIPNCDMRRLVQNIKNGHCRRSISSKYDFSNMNTVKRILSDDQIRIICNALEINHNATAAELLSLVGVDYNGMERKQKSCYASFISNIKHKKSFKNICNEYNY